MAKIKKKGTSGQAKNFITRTQAVRKLQISLPDFRRLCIFKGIYPREPRSRKKASKSSTPSTTFYYTKDIQYLLHEPLLAKFRDHKALAKKIGRALGRGEVGDAKRLEKTQTPRITLDHIIKERYPTFVDALRDLDDALSMLFLFANLPSTSTIPPKTIALCQRLCHEFEHYLIVSHSLRKSFLSIKGIYYQATIQGQDILWLVPYKFVQRVSGDIDFRIMGTFIEFYTTLLGFVNFRLYTSVGLIYPPKFNPTSDERSGGLDAFTLHGRDHEALQQPNDQKQLLGNGSSTEATVRAQSAADALAHITEDEQPATEGGTEHQDDENEPSSTGIDTFPASISADADVLLQPAMSGDEAAMLFAPFTFYLSRETPRPPLEFLLRAFGCKRVGWPVILGDGAFTNDEGDSRITHQVVDRPPVAAVSNDDEDGADVAEGDQTNGMGQRASPPRSHTASGRIPGRTYIQPQWVWDCVNAGRLLRPDLYAPGATLPPHLSPWVKPTKGAYDPRATLHGQGEEEAELEAEAAATVAAADADLENGNTEQNTAAANDDDDDDDEEPDDEEEDPDASSDLEEDASDDANPAPAAPPADDWTGFSSEDEDLASAARQHDLEAEARGLAPSSGHAQPDGKARARARAKREEAERTEQLERQKMMMSRRKRKLFERMQYGNSKREEERARLVAKRRRVDAAAAASGATPGRRGA